MAKTPRQEAHALINHFLKRYKAIYNTTPPGLNRYTLVFGFEALHLDYEDDARAIIDYYFDGYEAHDPKWFVQRYGDIAQTKADEEQDARERDEIYKQTIQMVKKKRKENT